MANYVLIVSGQSNAVGRAPNPIGDPAVAACNFSRTKIWVSGAWQTLNPADSSQSHDQSPGQHGMEPYIGYLFEQYYPNDTLYIIKFAEGGRGLSSVFSPDSFDPATGTLYATLVNNYISPGLASLSGNYTPLGFWWMQGETDSLNATTADEYYTNIKNFFNSIASDVPATANFKRVLGRIAPDGAWIYKDALRANQAKYCQDDTSNCFLINTDGIANNGGLDSVHYSDLGFNQLSQKVFPALTGISLVNGPDVTATSPVLQRRYTSATTNVSTETQKLDKTMDYTEVGELILDVRRDGGALFMKDEGGVALRYSNDVGFPDGSKNFPAISFASDTSIGLYKASPIGLGVRDEIWTDGIRDANGAGMLYRLTPTNIQVGSGELTDYVTLIGGGNVCFKTNTDYTVTGYGGGYQVFNTTTTGKFNVGITGSQPLYNVIKDSTVTTSSTEILRLQDGNSNNSGTHHAFLFGDSSAWNGNAGCYLIGKITATGRSINAAGTLNANGADYAEYMTKAGDFTIEKGDICGIDANGKLTNSFDDSISFVVKSTNPAIVGGDTWGNSESIGQKPEPDASQEDKDLYESKLQEERKKVDRIAFAGQVPVNVFNAQPGQFIVPTNVDNNIVGLAVDEKDMTFDQYLKCVGKVISIESDGRAKIIVKTT